MSKARAIGETIKEVLRTPAGREPGQTYGFDALEADGSTKPGLSEQVLAAMARAALSRNVEGVVFNEITAHRDEAGQLMRIEVDYMDQIHNPAPQTVTVAYDDSGDGIERGDHG